jgi:hypothetical protein
VTQRCVSGGYWAAHRVQQNQGEQRWGIVFGVAAAAGGSCCIAQASGGKMLQPPHVCSHEGTAILDTVTFPLAAHSHKFAERVV